MLLPQEAESMSLKTAELTFTS
ncbi:MAG: hypothetical protein QOD78_2584, partial [Chloroflexota bacterium]|nr:hypothetical protein [Chloroflexota bacterium]